MTKLKAFADGKINVAQMMISERVEKFVEKGENAGYQHFLFFSRFQKASFLGSCSIELKDVLNISAIRTG